MSNCCSSTTVVNFFVAIVVAVTADTPPALDVNEADAVVKLRSLPPLAPIRDFIYCQRDIDDAIERRRSQAPSERLMRPN